MSKNIGIPVLLIVFLVVSSLGQGVWADTVLCISGPDHAVFEPGQDGRCQPPAGETRSSHHPDEFSSAAGCGPCSDMQVFQDNNYQQSNGNPGNPPLPSGALVRNSHPCLHSLHPAKKAADFLSAALLSLRTTILLI